MPFNNLPTDILIVIFSYITQDELPEQMYWNDCMKLLSLCRSCRHIALPLVYRTISIGFFETLRSNAILMNETMVKYPRSVSIWVNCTDGNPVIRLNVILEYLQANRHLLCNITRLDIDTCFRDSRATPEQLISNKHEYDRLAQNLKTLLPNITTLLTGDCTGNDDSIAFTSSLIKLYAPHLRRTTVDSLVLCPQTHFTNPLTNLYLMWYPASNVLPKLDLSYLTSLVLSDIDDSFPWRIFSTDTKSTSVIHFPALQTMAVNLNFPPDDTDMDHNGYTPLNGPTGQFVFTLEAPRLHTLKIYDLCPFALSFLKSIEIPTNIEKLCTGTLEQTDIVFHSFNISAETRQVFKKHYNLSGILNSIDDIGLICDLMEINGLVDHGTHVSISRDLFFADIHYLRWPQVTRLTIISPISLTHILSLLALKLPDLTSLTVNRIELDVLKNSTLVIPELQDAAKFNPIPSKLRSLVYGFDTFDGYPQSLCILFEGFMSQIFDSLEYITLKE